VCDVYEVCVCGVVCVVYVYMHEYMSVHDVMCVYEVCVCVCVCVCVMRGYRGEGMAGDSFHRVLQELNSGCQVCRIHGFMC